LPDRHWVILAIGGARGITAEAVRAWLPYAPTLVLVGRTPLPKPDASFKGLSPGEIRSLLLKETPGQRPVEVERRLQGILRDREILANIEDFKRAGARVDYRVADVTQEEAVKALIGGIYRDHGRIDAVLHGAGIIEDRLLIHKTPDSISRVMDTKVDSTLFLMRYLRREGLKFMALFTSVAGRFGNRGQSDYATANEIVNRLAWFYQHSLGPATKVVAINWNPWAGTTHGQGMVTPEVQRQFEARGVKSISPEAGRLFLLKECLYAPPGEVEVIAGDAPWEAIESKVFPLPDAPGTIRDPRFPLLEGGRKRGQRIEKPLDLVSDPYLDHHRLDGVPVLPLAMACEYFAQGGECLEGQAIHTLNRVQRLAGLRLEDSAKLELGMDGKRLFFKEISAKRPAYQAEAAWGEIPPSPLAGPPPHIRRSTLDPKTCYRRWLFHGPCFQVIETIDGLDEKGISATLHFRPPALMDPAWHKTWRFHPFFLDGTLQLVVIWSRALRDTTPLPHRIHRLRRFGTAPFPPRMQARVVIASSLEDPHILCHIALVDPAGKLRLQVEGLEVSADASLNRLGGAWDEP
ncbi:MAG: SDR family NAD(P)-dependent oxidoreductase, partial [Gammaproteobacteria bacterium]